LALSLKIISKSKIMKTKMIIMTLVGVGLSLLTRAQIISGIKVGVNSAHLSGFRGTDRVGVNAGLFLHHTINNNWCFQPELLYSAEGQRYVADGEQRTLALDYLQVPLMIQYFPVRQLYFEFGPQFGLLLSATDKGPSGNENAKSDFTGGQVGMNLGVGVQINNQIGLYGRYTFGLTDVSQFDNIVDHSQVGQIGMAIRLR
jgi:hypothetical protein